MIVIDYFSFIQVMYLGSDSPRIGLSWLCYLLPVWIEIGNHASAHANANAAAASIDFAPVQIGSKFLAVCQPHYI